MRAHDRDTVSRTAWLAAYAVGLVVRVDGVPDASADAVTALVRAADGDVHMLADARARLLELVDLDGHLRGMADDLLGQAATRAIALSGAC